MKRGRVDRFVCAATSAVSSNTGLTVAALGTVYWCGDAALRRDWVAVVDGILSGGAALVALMIYREATPRDEAMHAKLDEIIHGTAADDRVAGIER